MKFIPDTILSFFSNFNNKFNLYSAFIQFVCCIFVLYKVDNTYQKQLQSEKKNASTKLQTIQSEINSLKTENSRLLNEKLSSNDTDTIKRKDQQINQLMQEINKLKSEKTGHNDTDTIKRKDQQINQLQEEINNLNKECNRLKSLPHGNVNSQIAELEESLQKELGKRENLIQDLKKEVDDLKGRNKNLADEKAKEKLNHDEKHKQLELRDGLITNLKHEMEDLKNKNTIER